LDVDNYKMANELGQLKARLADIESQQGLSPLYRLLKKMPNSRAKFKIWSGKFMMPRPKGLFQ